MRQSAALRRSDLLEIGVRARHGHAGSPEELLDWLKHALERLARWNAVVVIDRLGARQGPSPRRTCAQEATTREWAERLIALRPELGPLLEGRLALRALLHATGPEVSPSAITSVAVADRDVGPARRVVALCTRGRAGRAAQEVVEVLASTLACTRPESRARRRAQTLLVTSTGLRALVGPDLVNEHDLEDDLVEELRSRPQETAERSARLRGRRGRWLNVRFWESRPACAITILVEEGPALSWGELSELAALTPREKEVGDLARTGLGNAAIAWRLGLRERTIEGYLSSVWHKTGLAGRRALLALLTETP